jgi:hypothetical protein
VVGGRWWRLALVTLLLAACSGTTRVEGRVVDVRGDLTSVDRFTVLTDDGEELVLEPDPFGRFPFPLPHLREHLVSGNPIVVDYRPADDGTLIAVAVDDADGGH